MVQATSENDVPKCDHLSSEQKELRYRARLAWNNWPDTEAARQEIERHEARDPYSANAWDRVITALAQALIATEREACALTAERLKTVRIWVEDGKGRNERTPATGLEIAASIRSRTEPR